MIAGVSGGADSVCLLFVLLELQKELNLSIHAVHVNHGLRGEAADADEQFVTELCEQYHVPLEIFRVDLEWIAKNRKQSLEEAGREVRREAFLETAKRLEEEGAEGTRYPDEENVAEESPGSMNIKIALAHHQNDNAETLLWNLSRGTGLHGLGGIRPVHDMWIRPLLCVSREEIEGALAEMGQEFCTDLTNLETTYTRNKLRHQILPILEQEVNPATVRHMNEAMEQMNLLREFVEGETEKAVERVVQKQGVSVEILEQEWRALPTFLQNEVIYSCIEMLSGSRKDLGRIHVESVVQLFDLQVGRIRHLPDNLQAVRTYNGVRLEKIEEKENSGSAGGSVGGETFPEVDLQVPGVTRIPERNLEIHCEILARTNDLDLAQIPEKRYTKWFDYDIITSCLKARGRESGDWIVIDKEGHQKKLKSWFVNEKIPAEQRGRIPLIADGDQIIWIVGHRMSMAYQVSAQTKRILQINIKNMLEDKRDGRNN